MRKNLKVLFGEFVVDDVISSTWTRQESQCELIINIWTITRKTWKARPRNAGQYDKTRSTCKQNLVTITTHHNPTEWTHQVSAMLPHCRRIIKYPKSNITTKYARTWEKNHPVVWRISTENVVIGPNNDNPRKLLAEQKLSRWEGCPDRKRTATHNRSRTTNPRPVIVPTNNLRGTQLENFMKHTNCSGYCNQTWNRNVTTATRCGSVQNWKLKLTNIYSPTHYKQWDANPIRTNDGRMGHLRNPRIWLQ